jgi:hypothetical protein
MRRAAFATKSLSAHDRSAYLCMRTKHAGSAVMEANIGKTDKMIRIATGLLLLSLAFVGPQTPWGFIGLVPLATAFINFCPAYKLLGFNTLGK